MNEHPLIEAYVKPDKNSVLIYVAMQILNFMYFALSGRIVLFLVLLIVTTVLAAFITIRNRKKDNPLIRIYEDRIERKFALQKEYRRFYFKDTVKADIRYEFPSYEMLRLEFKDGRKPLKIQLSNLDVPIDTLYKIIIERINR